MKTVKSKEQSSEQLKRVKNDNFLGFSMYVCPTLINCSYLEIPKFSIKGLWATSHGPSVTTEEN